jgi:V8-like Glu-specific endopeptidase
MYAFNSTEDIFFGLNIIMCEATLSCGCKLQGKTNKMNKNWIFASIITLVGALANESSIAQEVIVSNLDNASLISKAEEGDKNGEISINGVIVEHAINPNNAGIWTYFPDGSRSWRYEFSSPGALAMGVIFNKFNLPMGSELYYYSSDKSWIEGPYSAEFNREDNLFRTAEVYGDHAVLEYREPAGVIGQLVLETRGMIHFFRMIEDPRSDVRSEMSDPCEVDVQCPEGDAWENEKHAVVRLSLIIGTSAGLCSGTLINNTGMDCKNYILTALHCTVDSNSSDLSLSSARFNYKRTSCGSGSQLATQNVTGLIRRADANDGGGNTGSDFALVELSGSPNSSWGVYYAGWDATDNLPTADAQNVKVTCLHHPAGDYMKISKANIAQYGSWTSANKHWQVQWMQTETEWGVTEGGSSGSPIFNNAHQQIGTLTGGGSYCTTPTARDYYGRMAKHWSGSANPNPASEKLNLWLDPVGTGWLTFNGAYKNSAASSPCAPASVQEQLAFDDVRVQPTLADQFAVVSLRGNSKAQIVKVFDSNGKLVDAQPLIHGAVELNTANLPNGLYYISVIQTNQAYITKKLIVNHK